MFYCTIVYFGWKKNIWWRHDSGDLGSVHAENCFSWFPNKWRHQQRVKHHAAEISCSKCVRLEPDIRVITCPYINIRGKNKENCALSSPQLVEQTKECRPLLAYADKKIIVLLWLKGQEKDEERTTMTYVVLFTSLIYWIVVGELGILHTKWVR